jgi:hypothetical protein
LSAEYTWCTISVLLASIMPKRDPTAQWVVERGKPKMVPTITLIAVANYALKPLGKSSLITCLPKVSITL